MDCPPFQTSSEGSDSSIDCACDFNEFAGLVHVLGVCRCPDNSYLEERSCHQCPAGRAIFLLPNASLADQVQLGRSSCKPTLASGSLQLGILLMVTLAAFLLPFSFRYFMVIKDTSVTDGVFLIATSLPHVLPRWAKRPVPVSISGTGHPCLDDPEQQWYVRHVGPAKLSLCDCKGQSVETPMETSMGTLRVRFPHSLMYCAVLFVPAWIWAAAFVVAASFIVMRSELPLAPTVWLCALALVLAVFLQKILLCAASLTPLAASRARFLRTLRAQHPDVQSCPPGSGRAISAPQLGSFFEAFHGFIRKRDMYYLAANIIKPLTSKQRVSYAELAGPHEVLWFVSHYWGSPFDHFVSTSQLVWEVVGSGGKSGAVSGLEELNSLLPVLTWFTGGIPG